jgi:hypothetical protein
MEETCQATYESGPGSKIVVHLGSMAIGLALRGHYAVSGTIRGQGVPLPPQVRNNGTISSYRLNTMNVAKRNLDPFQFFQLGTDGETHDLTKLTLPSLF